MSIATCHAAARGLQRALEILLLCLPFLSLQAAPATPPKLLQINRIGNVPLLYIGDTANIRWSIFFAREYEGWIIAEFSADSGATWSTIDSVRHRLDTGSIDWIIPSVETKVGQLRVRTSDSEASDKRTGLVLRPRPYVRLLRPNGGELLRIDSTVWIVWEQRSIGGHFWLEYSIDSGGYWYSIIARLNAREGLDSFAWSVPPMPSRGALVRISWEEGTLADTSDSHFRIYNPTVRVPSEERALPLEMDLTILLPRSTAPHRGSSPVRETPIALVSVRESTLASVPVREAALAFVTERESTAAPASSRRSTHPRSQQRLAVPTSP